MPVPMRERSIRLTTTMGRVVDLTIMPLGPGGLPFRWRCSTYDADIGEADAKRLLTFLAANYEAPQIG